METTTYPLTYFTNSTRAELDTIIDDLHTILPKGEIVNLFVENFNKSSFNLYGVSITDKLVWAVEHTLKYAIDTEMLINYIFSRGTEA
jgi:hypothetical protein